MGHDGEGDRLIDVVEPAGSDTFCRQQIRLQASGLAPAPAFPSTRRTRD